MRWVGLLLLFLVLFLAAVVSGFVAGAVIGLLHASGLSLDQLLPH